MEQNGLEAFVALWLAASVLSAAWVTWDVTGGGRHQRMTVMAVVWPLTMLYWGPPGLVFYVSLGRAVRVTASRSHDEDDKSVAPMWHAAFKGAMHCGAGCALGDFIGEWVAFGTTFRVAGSALGGKLLLAFVLAYLIGIAFQFFSIAPMRGLGLRDGIVAAVKADTLSLVAYEMGMFACMVAFAMAFPGLEPINLRYWILMQLAMLAGFITAYPVNWWLISHGMKEKM
ncbi:DUF4396 domain-containing protein [Paraburkholderia sp. A3BS-1L]|uniref:DUF4396 domain-containing protein n=1 Tax=Paraburkholderia sp. A3BS-1L TaxID=3028375 RepID=UPI003DAA2E8F